MRIVTLKFSDRIARLLMEVCEIRYASTIESLFDQIVEGELAALDLNKRMSRIVPKGRPDPLPSEDIGTLEKKCRFRGEESQKIVALHQKDVPARAIAKRLGCSVMKIHRVIHNYQRSKTRVPESTHVIIREGARAKSPRFNSSAERQI